MGIPLEDLLRVAPEEECIRPPMPRPPLVALMVCPEGVCPIYDLALLWEAERTGPPHAAPLVAMFPHPAGPVGVRLAPLLGVMPGVASVDAAAPPILAEDLVPGASSLPDELALLLTTQGSAGGRRFHFFSRDAFLEWLTIKCRTP